MAIAKHCDRCNRLYEFIMTPHTLDQCIVNGALDVCPECTRELFKIISKHEEKNDGSSE